MSSERSYQFRLIAVFFVFLLGLAIVSARLIVLHSEGSDQRKTSSTGYSKRVTELPHLRGQITDRNDELLVFDMPITTLIADRGILRTGKDRPMITTALGWNALRKTADFNKMTPTEQMAAVKKYGASLADEPIAKLSDQHLTLVTRTLATPLGLTQQALRERILEGKARGEVIIADDIPTDTAYKIKDLVKEHHLAGFIFRMKSKRSYAMPDLAPHTIGYFSQREEEVDGEMTWVDRPAAGIERAYDGWLTGVDGEQIEYVDVRGLPVRGEPGSLDQPRHGHHLQTTIDYRLQEIVEEELRQVAYETSLRRGTIIMMEPKSGEVLAIASYPTFDLESREGITEAFFHYALQAVYEPGSTFKVVAAAAALDDGLMDDRSTVFCHWGEYEEENVRLITDESKLGDVTLATVLAKSSNIGIFKVASMLGPDRFEQAIRDFGFLSESQLGVGPDHEGNLQDIQIRENLSRVSFGYSVGVTPMQMVSAYAAIANGGLLMQPTLLRKVISEEDNRALMEVEPKVVRRVISERTASTMRRYLEGVVQPENTGKNAMVPGFSVAGKTGTKTKRNDDGTYVHDGDERNVASFIGMMPADDPAFVCLVVLDDPQIEGVKRFGGLLAAPVFSRVAQRAAQCLNLRPDRLTAGDAVAVP